MHKATQHIPSLSPLRGIAALWVIFFHLDVIIFYRDLGPLIAHDLTGLLQKGYLWVDFFFILSGFIIAHVYAEKLQRKPTRHTIIDYLWARFTRLYPLHIATLLIAILVSKPIEILLPQVVDGSWQTYFAWRAIPSHLLFTSAMNQHTYLSWNIASWSIAAEWWTYVIALPLLIWVVNRKAHVSAALGLIAFALLAGLVAHLGNNKLDITYNYGFFRCLFEFTIGLCLYHAYRAEAGKKLLSADAAAGLWLVAIFAIFHWQLHDLLVVPVFCLLILSSAYNQGRWQRWLAHALPQYIGKISYSLYLVHSLWFLVFWNIFPHVQWTLINGELSVAIKIGFVVSFLALTFVCSHYSYRYIEVAMREKLRAWFTQANSASEIAIPVDSPNSGTDRRPQSVDY